MNKRLCVFGLILLSVFSSAALLACGDKFLIANRGTRFQRVGALRVPATILIYANPAYELNKVLASASVNATLLKVGYRPTTVATADEFEKALSRGGWDIVLAGVADAQAISNRLPKTVAVVPIVVNASELTQTRKQFKVVVKAPAKGQSVLSAIDEALAERPKPPRKA